MKFVWRTNQQCWLSHNAVFHSWCSFIFGFFTCKSLSERIWHPAKKKTLISWAQHDKTLQERGPPCQAGSHVARLNFKTSRVDVYKCLSLIVGFSVTVTIWLREVVSCGDFILCAVTSFLAMSLVGIYPGRASGNHRICWQKKIAFSYSDPGDTLENKLNDLKPLYSRKKSYAFQKKLKCSCLAG